MGLRDRCRAAYQQMNRNAILRQGSPVDDLMAFVQAELGRTADERLRIARKALEFYADRSNYDCLEIGWWARAERALEEMSVACQQVEGK